MPIDGLRLKKKQIASLTLREYLTDPNGWISKIITRAENCLEKVNNENRN